MSTPNHRIRLVMELRALGVSDTTVLGAIERVPRETFVPPNFRDRAYENTALPIGHGQMLSEPGVVGLMTQALELRGRMKVLEIGTGSGYQTAVLARLARRVYTIERHRPLLAAAEARFKELRLHNITTRLGDGWLGWPEQAPFERILLTAAPPDIPQTLLAQLTEDGIMVLPVGGPTRKQKLIRVRNSASGAVSEDIAPVRFVSMIAGLPPEASEGG
ncbi:MAG: protein-L-isoaspartate(D-aspartate) O-methyltransferase [Pseudomonadota bacterium]